MSAVGKMEYKEKQIPHEIMEWDAVRLFRIIESPEKLSGLGLGQIPIQGLLVVVRG